MTAEQTSVLRCAPSKFSTEIIALDDIHSVLDTGNLTRFREKLYHSLQTEGMVHPILVCRDTDFKTTDISIFERRPVPQDIQQTYRCLIGNNRYKFAADNGYTHIECHIVETLQQVKDAHKQTERG